MPIIIVDFPTGNEVVQAGLEEKRRIEIQVQKYLTGVASWIKVNAPQIGLNPTTWTTVEDFPLPKECDDAQSYFWRMLAETLAGHDCEVQMDHGSTEEPQKLLKIRPTLTI